MNLNQFSFFKDGKENNKIKKKITEGERKMKQN